MQLFHSHLPLLLLAVAATSGCSQTAPIAPGHIASKETRAQQKCAKPNYPTESYRANEQGTTKILFNVDENGDVTKATLLSTSGFPRLDNAAIEALTKCKFRTGIKDGKPTVSTTTVSYVWKIE